MRTRPSLRQVRSSRIDAWLDAGGTVLAANERAARSLTSDFHQARQAERLLAWHTPAIFSWDTWVSERWAQRNRSGALLLNALQEKRLWSLAIRSTRIGRELLHPGQLAVASQRAYQLLCDDAPQALGSASRLGWQGDPSTFSQWMESFDARCNRDGLISRSRLALDLAAMLRQESAAEPVTVPERPPLLLVGFDRLRTSQRALLDAWGSWELDPVSEFAGHPRRFVAAPDAASEIRSCVAWLRDRLRANPQARLMVVVAGLEMRRGALERELLSGAPSSDSEIDLDFEFSMGLPLAQMHHARSALLLLRWLHEPLSEAEVDWLLSSGHNAANRGEEIALAEAMRTIRRRGRERPSWRLETFLDSFDLFEHGRSAFPDVLAAWASRMRLALSRLRDLPRKQGPLDWVESARELLDLAGWPGFRPLSSIAFQVRERWERVLEDCASLGFDENDGSMEWDECIATLSDAVAETVFAAESGDARILITGPLESAGQLADGIWFLGADEEAWPGRGQPHPLLPIGLQRDAAMPHSSPQADWALAQQATARLIASGEEVVFSYAKQSSDAESRPSRLALQFLGEPETASLAENLPRDDRTEQFADTSLVPFPHRAMQGGAATLTDQSNCPFKAFATARMDARDWEPATAGLNPRQRGILLHAVLHRIWGGSTRKGIATHAELMAISDLRDFVANHVLQIMRENFDQTRSSALPDRFPARYLELESKRLTSLVAEWLDYERARVPFAVIETEIDTEVAVAGLTFKLRLDRIDAVGEGDKIVIDYKSSDKGPNMWAGERPEDVQLPLYATFAIAGGLEGLLIGQVRPSSPKLSGRVRNAKSTLFAGLSGSSGLVKAPLNETQLNEWRLRIEQLGEDFLAGHAEVDPREPGKTCESCHLQAVCRINENDPLRTSGTDEEEESAGEDDHA